MPPENTQANSIHLLVSIFLKPGKGDILRAYEQQARRVMNKHGGDFERIMRPLPNRPALESPDEVHLLRFPSESAFAAFRHDPELAQHLPLREAAVERFVVLFLEDIALSEYFGHGWE
jgi:uncharacterized protein (DUF1330 family)